MLRNKDSRGLPLHRAPALSLSVMDKAQAVALHTCHGLMAWALAGTLAISAGCAANSTRPLTAEREAHLLALSMPAVNNQDWTDLYSLCVLRSKQRDYARLTTCVERMTTVVRSVPVESELVDKKQLFKMHGFPLYPKALLLRAQAHLDFGEYAEAIAVTAEAVALASGLKDRYPLDVFQLHAHNDFLIQAEALLSIAHHFLGDEKASKQHLSRLQRLDTSPEKFVWRAQVAMACGRDAEALHAFDELKAWNRDQAVTGIVEMIGLIGGAALAQHNAGNKGSSTYYTGPFPAYFGSSWQALLAANLEQNLLSFQRGHLQLGVGRLDEARQSLEALLHSPDVEIMGAIYWAALFDRGRLAEAERKPQDAAAYYQKSIVELERIRSSINSEASRIGFVGDKQRVYHAQVELLLREGRVQDAFAVSERSKARVLVEMLAEKGDFSAHAAQDDSLKALLERQAEADKLRVSEGFASEPVSREVAQAGQSLDNAQLLESTRNAMRSVTARGDAAQKTIRENYPNLAPLISAVEVSPAAIQAALHPDEVLLSYYYTAAHLYAFVVSSGSIDAVQLERAGLEPEVTTLRQQLSDPTADYQQSSKQLYGRLIGPVRMRLNNHRLIIAPYGVLHHVPFGALSDGARFLADDMTVVYLPSASTIKYVRGRPANDSPQAVLAFGDPDLGKPELELRFAKLEAERVASVFAGSIVLTGKAASKAKLRELGARFRYLHFATHGIFDVVHPLNSALLLAPRADAGAQDSGELTAAEVYDLRLNADLVALSACESGLGKVRSGDEVIGLVRAFMYAGARRIVSSLWPVEDEATAKLMNYFYAALKDDPDAGEALKNAARRLRKEGWEHPYYWAPFVLAGDP
jgi:CHAT domain-containing protein